MKTAISLPDTLYEQAEQFRSQLRLSRSELYSQALRLFLESKDEPQITAALNRVYSQQNRELEGEWEQAQAEILSEESW